VRGLYRGLSASYLGVTESTLQWVLYEQMKIRLARREERLVARGGEAGWWDETVRWGGKVGAAGGAKFVAALITYPHEVCCPYTLLRDSFSLSPSFDIRTLELTSHRSYAPASAKPPWNPDT
jgi:hypothetical protein